MYGAETWRTTNTTTNKGRKPSVIVTCGREHTNGMLEMRSTRKKDMWMLEKHVEKGIIRQTLR